MPILVAYGSKRGGTAGLAGMIGEELNDIGHVAVVQPARTVRNLAGFDGVVIAGALYANRWHRDARRLARRHAAALRERAVWFVSSGPLDASAAERDIPPVKQVRRLMQLTGARGHVTFGGRLEPDAKGFPASAMAKSRAGDWRDRTHVRGWVSEIAVAA